MKFKKLGIVKGLLVTMLIALIVFGVTPSGNGTRFGSVVAEASGVASASTTWDIAIGYGEKLVNGTNKEGVVIRYTVKSDGYHILVYYNYKNSNMGDPGRLLGKAPIKEGTHTVTGDLETMDGTSLGTGRVTIVVTDSSQIAVKPNAPKNVVISQDGTYVSAVSPKGTRTLVIDAKGNVIGRSADASYIELSRTLKSGETISLVAEDMQSNLRSDIVYATFKQVPKEVTMEVWYVDIDTTKPIAPMGTIKGQENTQIQVDAITVAGYDLVTQSPQIVIGESGGQIVFQYKKQDPNSVENEAILTTKFVDESGQEIANAINEKVKVNSIYTAKALVIDGYEVDGNDVKKGIMNKDGKTETFVYKKKAAKNPQGDYIPDGRYVTVMSKNYNTWQNFSWKEKHSANVVSEKTYQAKGRYEHENGQTYYSLYDGNGVWQGYINAKATKVGNGKQGAYISDGRYVTVTSKGYNTWQNFSWKEKYSANLVTNKTYQAKGKYVHVNGSTYLSLYNDKGIWQGYINEKGTNIGSGRQGAYISDGRTVTVIKKNYEVWQNFDWKQKQSSNNLLNKKYTARGRYEHSNGSTYYSLYDGNGVWQGYINAKAVR